MATRRLDSKRGGAKATIGGTARGAALLLSIGLAPLAPLAAAAAGESARCLDVVTVGHTLDTHAATDDRAGHDDGIGGTGLGVDSDGIGGTGLGVDSDGIGGTGLDPGDDDGIGGTGLRADADGIGGTGLGDLPAPGVPGMSDASLDRVRASGDALDAALLGGSDRLVRIVGLHDDGGAEEGDGDPDARGACEVGLRLSAAALIEEGGSPRSVADLHAGQIVWLSLAGEDADVVEGVSLRPIVEGPVVAVDDAAARLDVMGETVVVTPETRILSELDGGALDLPAIGVGDSVVIHGMRSASGDIRATYIGLRSRSPFARVWGWVEPDPGCTNGASMLVGTVRVATPEGAAPELGRWVEVRGRWDTGSKSVVDARIVAAGPTEAFAVVPKGRRSGSRMHLGERVPVSTR